MTVSATATKIKERIDAITETTNSQTVKLVSKSWIGDIGEPLQIGEIVVTIMAKSKDREDFNYPGNTPPSLPYWVPWEIFVMVAGQDVTTATTRLYEVTDLIEDALRSDLSFSGTCDEGVLPPNGVTYGAGGLDKNDLKPTSLISLKTYYTP